MVLVLLEMDGVVSKQIEMDFVRVRNVAALALALVFEETVDSSESIKSFKSNSLLFVVVEVSVVWALDEEKNEFKRLSIELDNFVLLDSSSFKLYFCANDESIDDEDNSSFSSSLVNVTLRAASMSPALLLGLFRFRSEGLSSSSFSLSRKRKLFLFNKLSRSSSYLGKRAI